MFRRKSLLNADSIMELQYTVVTYGRLYDATCTAQELSMIIWILFLVK